MKLVAVIDDNGIVYQIQAETIEGAGILDIYNGWNPAGLDEQGNLYAAAADDKDNVLTMDAGGTIPGFKLGMNYKHLLK